MTVTTRLVSRAGLLLALALVGLLSGVLGASSASAKSDPDRPTIVLLHGAWASPANWDDVAGRLRGKGYTVDVPPNPLRSLAGDSAYLAGFLNSIHGPIVLVGHSYGGAVVTNAATGDPDVKALVYVNAFAPDEGESVLNLALARPGSTLAADPATVFDLAPYPNAPAGDVDLYIKPELFPEAFANDLPLTTARALAATQRPAALSALAAPSGPPAWRSIPSWYLLGTADHVIPPAEQRFMAERAGAHIAEVDASHMSMVSRPGAVSSLIRRAARGAR